MLHSRGDGGFPTGWIGMLNVNVDGTINVTVSALQQRRSAYTSS
jgi:hypothetical protein